jgi:hypothetical protein
MAVVRIADIDRLMGIFTDYRQAGDFIRRITKEVILRYRSGALAQFQLHFAPNQGTFPSKSAISPIKLHFLA